MTKIKFNLTHRARSNPQFIGRHRSHTRPRLLRHSGLITLAPQTLVRRCGDAIGSTASIYSGTTTTDTDLLCVPQPYHFVNISTRIWYISRSCGDTHPTGSNTYTQDHCTLHDATLFDLDGACVLATRDLLACGFVFAKIAYR